MCASYPLGSYFDKYKHRLLRYSMYVYMYVTDESAVSLWPLHVDLTKGKGRCTAFVNGVYLGIGCWVLLKMGTRMCILSCPGALLVLELMAVGEVTFLSFSHSSLSRESSIPTSAPLVGALVSCRAQRAMGARCLCFGTALRTHSKPSSVLLAMRTGYSAAGAVQAKNGISTCTKLILWYCTSL